MATASNILWNGRVPSQVSVLAILVAQQRGYATEQSTSTPSSQSYPPPGFNAEQAKKPLPQSQQASSAQSASKTQSADSAQALNGVKTQVQESGTTKAVATEDQKNGSEEKKESKKLTIGQKIKKEIQHYWDGTKLLATEVKISSRLALKMAAGYELSRREHRQVCWHPRARREFNQANLYFSR